MVMSAKDEIKFLAAWQSPPQQVSRPFSVSYDDAYYICF